MKNTLNQYIRDFQQKHRNYRRYLFVLVILAVVTVAGVNWRLHGQGISMTSDYQCGKEEHTHSADCYEKILICGKEETDGSEGHTHTDDCYTTERKLTCGEDEHTHGDECYDEDGNLICEKKEHTHSDDCYTTERNLTCGKEESKAVKAHHHSDDCYEEKLTCGKEEHTHSIECMIDESADVETSSDWEATLPDLTGSWDEDMAAIAASQVGYTESEKNFKLDDDGETKKGYTRYGEWYGNKYGDWSAMFAAFCLHYAGVDGVPTNSGVASFLTDVKSDAKDLCQSADDYNAKLGDLVFLDLEGDDGKADHIGILTKVDTEDKKTTSFKAVVGDLDGEVQEKNYKASSANIVAYVSLPEQTEKKSDDADEADEKTTEESEEASTAAKKTKKKSAAKKSAGNANDAQSGEDGIATVSEDDGTSTHDESGSTGVNMNGYITSVSFQKKNGVIWEESTEFTTAGQVRGTINFENVYTSLIKSNNNTLYIDLPAYIDCSKFTGTYETYDGGTKSGTYTYQKNDDGSYRIVLKLDDNYVNNAGDVIGGSMQFNFNWTKDAVDDSGTKKVEIGNWSGDIKITEDKSGDDKPSSANYNIWKNAGSLYYSDDGKTAYIDYTISLQVKQDTKAPIVLKDILTGEGFTYDDTTGVSVESDTVKANFDSLNKETYSGNNPNTNIQLWAKNSDTIPAGWYTIKYRVQTVKDMSDPDASLPSDVSNKIETPKDGDSSISSETHTTITTGTINKQGQLVSGSDATYIDYTVYLNAGAIIKNLKEGANFTDTLPDTLELQGDVTVKQYDVTGTLQNTTTATVDGQNISYTTPTGQYYYVITYRTKVKDSELPIGGSVTIKNDGKSTGGVDGSSSSEITVTNHKLTKSLVSGETSKKDGKWIRTSNWTSNVAVKGNLEGYVYEDYSSLFENPTTLEKYAAMKLVEGSVMVKDASGKEVSSDLYTLEESTHKSSQYLDTKGGWYEVSDGLFKITFKNGVTGPITIEYQTTADMSLFSEGAWTGVTNHAELSKDGHKDTADAQDNFQFVTDNKGLIYKKQDNTQWGEISGTTTLKPGENSIPWVILVNRAHTMTGDFTVTDTIKDGLIFLPDTLEIRINQESIKDKEGVTWSFNKETGKLTVSVKESAYKIENQNFTHTDVTIAFKTQLPDEVIKSDKTDNITYKNTATLETNGEQTDSTYEQKVIREVVGKSGSYDKNTHILSYNVVVNPDSSKLNSGNTLTVTDTLDAGSIAEHVKLHSLDVFTALKNTDASGNVKVEPGALVKTLTLTPATDSSLGTEFTYTCDETNKKFTTYLPDSTAYVIVAKYYVDTDVSADVQMKNTVKIEGNDAWKKEDSSTKVEQNTSGETHTNKVTVVKHDSAQYSTVLAGAAFKLEKYDNSAWTEVGSATTGSDGTALINSVTFNTLYKLGETQAPDGYVLDEGPVYFVVATTGTSEADAKKNLPETIAGDDSYSKDAVKVYYAKNGENDAINIEVDRYNTKDATKVEPGELRVNKVWVDSKGKTVTDARELAKMSEVSVTLTKHVANTGHTITIGSKVLKNVNDGAYVYLAYNSGDTFLNNLKSAIGSDMVVTTDEKYNNLAVCKIGPIKSDLNVQNNAQYNFDSFVRQEGGTAAEGTTDTVIGTVTLNAANDWTYLWSNLDRSDGVTYTLTETTVDGYNVSYKLNGEDREAGITFTLGESGDKLTVTNTANPEYDLPSTGGIGTLWYIAGGIALMGGSLLCGFILRRRRERGGRVE